MLDHLQGVVSGNSGIEGGVSQRVWKGFLAIMQIHALNLGSLLQLPAGFPSKGAWTEQ